MTGFTVTDEAVEAAAGAHWDAGSERFSQRLPWAQLVLSFPIQAGDERAAMRVALEAAARTAQPAAGKWVDRLPPECSCYKLPHDGRGDVVHHPECPNRPQLTATREKLTEALHQGQRWYVPAYQAPTGAVIAIGDETVAQEYAEQDAARLSGDDDETEVFVATRMVLPWERAAAFRAGGQHG